MQNDLKFPVKLCLTDSEGFELYRLLTDDRPPLARMLDPIRISDTTISRLHSALRDRSLRNKL